MTKTENLKPIKIAVEKWLKCPRCKSKSGYFKSNTNTHRCRKCGQLYYADYNNSTTRKLAYEPIT